MYNVMIVDDEELILKSMARMFRFCSELNVEYYQSPVAALRRCQTAVFDVILSDYRMPEMSGVDFLIETKTFQPEAIRLILSAHVDAGSLMRAINSAHIDRYLTKPWDNEVLVEAIYDAGRRRTIQQENRILSDLMREEQPKGPFHCLRKEQATMINS